MRKMERIFSINSLVKELWESQPDMRFLQLLDWIESEYSKQNGGFGQGNLFKRDSYQAEEPFSYIDLFYLEDELLEQFLLQLVKDTETRLRLEKVQAEKGSKHWIQQFVNNRQGELNHLILMSSPSLLTFLDKERSIQWKSPLRETGYQEYRNEFLELESVRRGRRIELEKYWPRMGPQWDGYATVAGKDGQKGFLLVEAKAHLKEMTSSIRAKDLDSRFLIESTMKETMEAMGSRAPMEVWLNRYYQLANRLAFLYILNEKMGIPTWLVLVNFLEDDTHIPTGSVEWVEHYQEVFSEMDITSESNPLFDKIVTVYPSCN
ncbi:hypothetical protein ACQKL0_16830 [Peribacillus sp. NPDC097264]|uniref:hypothetical protein n=1 Tax=Peribacillus sp. NPDC097264 TaxID=3390616 RepID=UPI003D0460C2